MNGLSTVVFLSGVSRLRCGGDTSHPVLLRPVVNLRLGAQLFEQLHGSELQLAPFKGVKQQYRPWDGQFRQPILIATDKVPVSLSPQRGFPHASHPEIEMDTLGIDEPESTCKM
jgi:ABC transporter substrate binding protein (PQQ-dependent alcohol dehydrogenase system)